MKLTNKGDIDWPLQLLPSFPPSLLFDPVDVKAGSSTKHPVWKGRKHLFFLPFEKLSDVIFHETFNVKIKNVT